MSTRVDQPLSFAQMILRRLDIIDPLSPRGAPLPKPRPLPLHDFPQQSATATNSAEDRGLGTTGNLNPDVLFRIARAAHLSLELDKKSDEEIAQMLLQTVWAEMHTGTLEAELVDQAITRLRKETR